MKYPNNSKKNYNKNISYSNRGMNLESYINLANQYYIDNSIALVYKKPVPITVLKTDKNKISDAFFKEKSTLDYIGVYKGKYIEFDAKETKLSSLPLSNIHNHQINHIRNLIKHDAITFLIIMIKDEFYLLMGSVIIYFIDKNERKSIPYEFIKKNGIELKYNYLKGLNYIEKLEEIYEKN